MTADHEVDEAQDAYDAQADAVCAMRTHIWRLHCRVRELASILEMRPPTPVSERSIREARQLLTEGVKYE